MRVLYYGLLGILLAASAMPDQRALAEHRHTGARVDKNASVAFNLYRGYLIVAPGAAEPLKNLNFLIDTGASATILDQRVARALNLQEEPAAVAVLDGKVRAAKARAPSLSFGPLRGSDFPVLIQDLSFLEKSLSLRVDAVIGLDLLAQSAFAVDYTSRVIYFGPAPPLSISVPLRVKEGLVIIDAEMNHAPVQLLLDTGASSLIIFQTRLPKSLATLETGVVKHSTNLHGNFERDQMLLHAFRLGDAEFGQKSAFVVHDVRDAGRDFDGLMSPAALGITRVSVDIRRGLLSFSR